MAAADQEPPFPEALFPLPPTTVQPTYLCRKKISSSNFIFILPNYAKRWILSIDRNKAKEGYKVYLRTRLAGQTEINLIFTDRKVQLRRPWRSMRRDNNFTTNTEVDIWGYIHDDRVYLVMNQYDGVAGVDGAPAAGVGGNDEASAASPVEDGGDDGPGGGSVFI